MENYMRMKQCKQKMITYFTRHSGVTVARNHLQKNVCLNAPLNSVPFEYHLPALPVTTSRQQANMWSLHGHTRNIDTEGISGSSLIRASADWGLDCVVGAGRERGRCEDVQVRGRWPSRWEGSGKNVIFTGSTILSFPSIQVTLCCSFLLPPTQIPLLHHILTMICFLFILHFVAVSANCMLGRLSLTPFPPSLF